MGMLICSFIHLNVVLLLLLIPLGISISVPLSPDVSLDWRRCLLRLRSWPTCAVARRRRGTPDDDAHDIGDDDDGETVPFQRRRS